MRKFAILLVLAGAVVFSTQAQPSGISVQLELDQSQYLPDEDVQVKITIVNRSGQPVVLGTETNWLSFGIVGEHDYMAPRLGEMPVKGPFTLLSGQSVTKVYNPTPYFGFRRLGNYSLGAIVNVPRWKQEIKCKPVFFTIVEATPLAHLGDLAFGVPPPPGVSNAAPEVRHYSLLKIASPEQIKLYFRLTDSDGQTLRVYPLARMVDFGDPEAQMDQGNNLHVLFQTGARTFTYCVVSPNGNLLARQFHEYAQSRPRLRLADDGQIAVGGGRRLLTWNDIPAPAPAPGTAKSQ